MNQNFAERRLGNVVLKVHQTTADLEDIVPNEQQPRQGPKEDAELRRQIVANGGLFEPLLVEPLPDTDEKKYLIIDGERRWTNLRMLVTESGENDFKRVPIIVTDKPLNREQRLRIWVYIHRQRKEWSLREREGVAYSLFHSIGSSSAADILGITVRELEKLVETFDLSKNIVPPNDPDASISYAREIISLATKVRTEEVVESIVKKINDGTIKISKDIRSLRKILKEDAARNEFLRPGGTIESATSKLSPQSRRKQERYGKGLFKDVDTFLFVLKSYPYFEVVELRGDENLINKLEEIGEVIDGLKRALSK